jgi:hypothetical protein
MAERDVVNMQNEAKNFLIYSSPTNQVRVDVFVQNETLWLTQKAIASLFEVSKSTISEHLSNIYSSNELNKVATVREFRTVQTEGTREVTRNVEYYNLDAIISVGYRVNSAKATQYSSAFCPINCNAFQTVTNPIKNLLIQSLVPL